ncbi:carboxymuconolactone decarboxylase family protein [Acidicapsa acidisoli]|uniref:carboxymuconolactone decarboxylase family protein n=1 Tax=Acidicapsa acidisoli TaxID=1615681 RepID=UPI0021E04343|nr:carboxymuconolactone decarboxylase family protein [Acidicapsa acidisoli]
MSSKTSAARLGLVDPETASPSVKQALAKLPAVNGLRAMANAESLYPAYIDFLLLLFRPLEIDPALERMIALRVATLQECLYIWRNNVVVARSVGMTEEQISVLERGDTVAKSFSPAQQAAFAFTDEVVFRVEATDATYDRAKQYFSDRALTEILFVIGNYMLVARVIRTGRVPLDEKPTPFPQQGA